jgi:predicted metal-binding membrane protein
MTNTRKPDLAFMVAAALVFVVSSAVTIVWCGSMSAMPGMEMPGGWTMSMAWMRMPGQSWAGAAATFLGMWTVMIIAMMLPVLMPKLSRYRASRRGDAGLSKQTALVAAGYFTVWALSGIAVYPLGLVLAETTMRMPGFSRAMPLASGLVLVVAGLLQFSRRKARLLACCRETPGCCGERRASGSAWRHGWQFGIQCVSCCLGPTAALLVIGVMDLHAMALVTLAICAERLAPSGERVARVIGAILIASAPFVIQQS